MASGPNVSANLSEAERLIKMSVESGAELVVLPENFALMGMKDLDTLKIAEDINNPGEILEFLSNTAKYFGIWLLGGTVPIKTNDTSKILSASILFNDKGEQVARYDKIHLFDMDLSESSGAYHESSFTKAGSDIITIDSPFGKLGIAICYDIRFPELFRKMTKSGMQILLLPSSFTAITGQAHWEILNRSRAIENLCYVVTSAQGGYHVNGRETYGHSMIVSPWGKILDQLNSGSGFVIADVDKNFVEETRNNFPVLEHRKLICDFTEIA
ncbi:MAG: carbon-nitrogen hydrolase family protein [Gammaproteobacteria bacterium]|nr:carbon-nitrogen hydrolase family protein [Gammaproteobacteria bacterium]